MVDVYHCSGDVFYMLKAASYRRYPIRFYCTNRTTHIFHVYMICIFGIYVPIYICFVLLLLPTECMDEHSLKCRFLSAKHNTSIKPNLLTSALKFYFQHPQDPVRRGKYLKCGRKHKTIFFMRLIDCNTLIVLRTCVRAAYIIQLNSLIGLRTCVRAAYIIQLNSLIILRTCVRTA